jgi:hypothetical protein
MELLDEAKEPVFRIRVLGEATDSLFLSARAVWSQAKV